MSPRTCTAGDLRPGRPFAATSPATPSWDAALAWVKRSSTGTLSRGRLPAWHARSSQCDEHLRAWRRRRLRRALATAESRFNPSCGRRRSAPWWRDGDLEAVAARSCACADAATASTSCLWPGTLRPIWVSEMRPAVQPQMKDEVLTDPQVREDVRRRHVATSTTRASAPSHSERSAPTGRATSDAYTTPTRPSSMRDATMGKPVPHGTPAARTDHPAMRCVSPGSTGWNAQAPADGDAT